MAGQEGMTESQFETRLRQMAKAGGQAASRDLTGMAADIQNALEKLDIFHRVEIRKTGEPMRLLAVRARGHRLVPDETMAWLDEAFNRDIRYSGESFRWTAIERSTVRFRFATGSASLWASGEIVVETDS
jgi:hypothetical protein